MVNMNQLHRYKENVQVGRSLPAHGSYQRTYLRDSTVTGQYSKTCFTVRNKQATQFCTTIAHFTFPLCCCGLQSTYLPRTQSPLGQCFNFILHRYRCSNMASVRLINSDYELCDTPEQL